MSTDITLYEDEDINIVVTCGGWGARLYIGQPFRNGAFGEYARDLLTEEKLDLLIKNLESIRTYTKEEDNG